MSEIRTSLCLGCRTALSGGEACDCGSKSEVSLVEPGGRGKAVRAANPEEHVAGVTPPSTWLRLSFMAFVGLTLMGAAGATIWATLRYGGLGFIAGTAVGGLLVLVALLSPMTQDSSQGRGAEEIVVLRKGTTFGPWPRSALVRVSGQIRSTHDPAASLVELSLAHGEITLRDATSAGFRVELDGGRTVVVPPGRVRIDPGKAALQSLSHRETRQHLALIDPAGASSRDNPFPFDRARTLQLRDGDRVTVAAEGFEESWERDGGYREGGAITLRPRGLVWLLPA